MDFKKDNKRSPYFEDNGSHDSSSLINRRLFFIHRLPANVTTESHRIMLGMYFRKRPALTAVISRLYLENSANAGLIPDRSDKTGAWLMPQFLTNLGKYKIKIQILIVFFLK